MCPTLCPTLCPTCAPLVPHLWGALRGLKAAWCKALPHMPHMPHKFGDTYSFFCAWGGGAVRLSRGLLLDFLPQAFSWRLAPRREVAHNRGLILYLWGLWGMWGRVLCHAAFRAQNAPHLLSGSGAQAQSVGHLFLAKKRGRGTSRCPPG